MALVLWGAMLSTKYAEKFAESFYLSKYVVGFIVVSFVSILPETLISVDAGLRGQADFGLGTLFGSNVADLTLIMAILVFIAGRRRIHVEKHMLTKIKTFPLFLTMPLVLGLDGHYSREEGLALMVVGIIFYIFVFKKSVSVVSQVHDVRHRLNIIGLFLVSMVLLLVGAHYSVDYAVQLAMGLGVNEVLVGLLIVSLGTTLPELFFSAHAIKKRQDSLALGDILGAVLADATVVLGLLAVITPFAFDVRYVYVTGAWMLGSALLLLAFMRSGHTLSRREGVIMLLSGVLFVFVTLGLGMATS